MPVIVNQEICIGCGACEMNCPVRAIYINDEGVAECDPSECLDCGECLENCQIGAIRSI